MLDCLCYHTECTIVLLIVITVVDICLVVITHDNM